MTEKVTTSPRPSYIPVLNDNRHKVTPQVTQPAVQPTICSLPRPSGETILKQPMQIHPEPTKSPLLPTPPAHNRQSTSPRSSASNCSRNSTFSRPLPTFSRPSPIIPRPSPRNNYRFHQQTSHFKTIYYKIQQPTTTTTSKTIIPTPELLHKTISTASTATRTLYTASISSTICSYHNTDTIQPDQQRPSTANKTLQPEPTITDKQNTSWKTPMK